MTNGTGVSKRSPKPFSVEVCERVVRLVTEQQPAYDTQWVE